MVKITFDVPKKMLETAQAVDIKTRTYDICFDCPFYDTTCAGPNEGTMTMPQRVNWWKRLGARYNTSRQKAADKSGIPLDTINSIYSGRTADPRHSTMHALSMAYSHGSNMFPCHMAALMANGELCEEVDITALQAELSDTREKLTEANVKIAVLKERLHNYGKLAQEEMSAVKADDKTRVDFLKEQITIKDKQIADHLATIRHKDKVLAVLGITLAIVVFGVLLLFAIDNFNPDVGWFRY